MDFPPPTPSRRAFLRAAGAWAASTALLTRSGRAASEDHITLPFANGDREVLKYPEKRALIRLTSRPPQLETPFSVFQEGILTPNDAFFVRYHLSGIPTRVDPATFRLRVGGHVNQPLDLTLSALKDIADSKEIVAVNQCSGNSRGFFSPRVAGGQIANGAMGNARWKGIPLKAVLDRAGLKAGARQVAFEGLDRPVIAATPEFVKALPVDHAADGEVMIAYEMNGERLPFLNGYPLRLVVPGFFGTYWVKHLSDITVLDHDFTGFWMASAYRIPDNPNHSAVPGVPPPKTIPINRLSVRSFVTNLEEGAKLRAAKATPLRGIAFDGGDGIRQVDVSTDQGKSWQSAELGKDLGRYSFREWTANFSPSSGAGTIDVRATNNAGEVQPTTQPWNPSGYMRNVIERISYVAALLVFASILALYSGCSRAVEISLPAETAQLTTSSAPGYSDAAASCYTCHSVDYIRSQPPAFTRATWKAEVVKMRNVYAAPIPEGNIDAIAEYLAQTYGAERVVKN